MIYCDILPEFRKSNLAIEVVLPIKNINNSFSIKHTNSLYVLIKKVFKVLPHKSPQSNKKYLNLIKLFVQTLIASKQSS